MRRRVSKRPLLSIVLPTCDRQKETERAIASILVQDVEDLEIIVIDDFKERPFQLPDQLRDGRLKLVRHNTNLGAAAARNTGTHLASGHWLGYLDSDDWWPKGTLRVRLQYAEERQKAGDGILTAYGCGFSHFSETGGVLRTRIPQPAERSEEFASGCWFCPGSAVLILRHAAMLVGPQDCSLRRLEDFDWFLRFSLQGGKLAVQNIVGAMIRAGHVPLDQAVAVAAKLLEHKWIDLPSELSAKALRNLRSYLLLEQAASELRNGAHLAGATNLIRSLMVVPRIRPHLSPAWVNIKRPSAYSKSTPSSISN